MLGSDSQIISRLPSLPKVIAPKPNASNVHTASVGTEAADQKPQQPRKLVFRARIACVFTLYWLKTTHDLEYQKLLEDHIHSNRKWVTNISNMVFETVWVHLFQKFYLLSSDWRSSVSRPAHSRIRHSWWTLSTPKTLTQPESIGQASKSGFHRLHQPQLNQAPSLSFFSRQTDGRTLSSGSGWCWKREICCSMDIQGTQACDLAIVFTTGECLPRFVWSMCHHLACLVTFSRMRSQPAIHGFRSGFYERKTSHAHQEMLWHPWFHPKTVDRSVWHASTFLQLYLRHSSMPRASPMHPKHRTHTTRDVWPI